MLRKATKLLALIIFSIIAASSLAQENPQSFGTEVVEAEYQFAFRLIPSNETMYFQCALVKFDADGKMIVQQLPAENWARQAMGLERSKANPEKKNFIVDEYKLFELPPDILTMLKSDYSGDVEQAEEYAMFRLMVIMNNMWHLRYRRHPFEPVQKKAVTDNTVTEENKKNMQQAGIDVVDNSPDKTKPENLDFKGWANNEDPKVNGAPNKAQMNILKKYGMNEISDFVYGDNAFKLMKDALDPQWQNTYMNTVGTGEDPSLKK
jgi:hypothetical protein